MIASDAMLQWLKLWMFADLYGNPDAPHVRILQMQMLLRRLEDAARVIRTEGSAQDFERVILCGDLNAEDDSGGLCRVK